MADTADGSAQRLVHLDLLRGLIMLTMALDHVRAFVVREHPFEIWSQALPHYDAVLPFLTRLLTHFCAPGFFFLMGAGVTLFASARRRDDWSTGRIARHLVTRGVLLVVVQQLIENPAWILGSMGAAKEPASGGFQPAGVVLGVLYALGMSMALWGLLLRLPSIGVLLISAAAIVATQTLTPSIADAATSYSPLLRLLLIPGKTGVWFVIYPVIPWLGLTGMGIVFGRALADGKRLAPQALAWGAVFLILFVMVRSVGGFGNIHVPVPEGWIGFLNVTKYPPSLAFIALTLGVDLIVLGVLAAFCSGGEFWALPLLTFGRSALFFYIAHLYVYAVIGFAFPHGAPIAMAYPPWFVGLLILYPLCRRYERFKHRRPTNSLWRFF
ncbi:MAG: DUF1624 domain-containing protein [Deltaproteobacteria bacterium]|nr:DUF1624 domain-containing protein [Deltaproteobacteria bacterium]